MYYIYVSEKFFSEGNTIQVLHDNNQTGKRSKEVDGRKNTPQYKPI